MLVLGIDKDFIVRDSSGGYVFNLGAPVGVTSISKLNYNRVLSVSFSKSLVKDKLMLNYSPSNNIYFTEKFMKSDGRYASAERIGSDYTVGAVEEFNTSAGILATSGILSMNGIEVCKRHFYCVDRLVNVLRDRARVVGCGLVKGGIFGVLYVPSLTGLFVEDDEGRMISAVTQSEPRNPANYNEYTIDDWFEMDLVREGTS